MSYMEVVEAPIRMKGKGAPRDTTFGVIGHTKETGLTKSLGGLVKDTKTLGPSPKKSVVKANKLVNDSDHHILGMNKTKLPGAHHGMVPYPGYFMKALGKGL